MSSTFIGIVKSNEYNMRDVNERGWCFSFVEYKDGLYFVWFSCPMCAALEDVKEYSLVEISDYGELLQEYHSGDIITIKYLNKHKRDIYKDFIRSHNDSKYNWDSSEKRVKEWLNRLHKAYKYRSEFN